ncbi:lipopolysaccharide biosynthesis protein [Actinomadura sp. 3N407]|uniref:lipopolysaccharide biosynthesis protein n=1 Tax=Actinomadura sp. 3N407 TaxID=3457423 RepID=UPI003FCC8AA1
MKPARTGSLLGGHGWAAGPTLLSSLASGTAAGTTLVIARGAGPREFGHFTLVLTIALIVAVGMLMSLHYVMLQELPRAEPADRPALVATAFLSTLALGGGLTAAGALLSPILAVPVGVDARTLCLSFALGLSLALNQLTEGLLRGLKRYTFVATLKLAVAVAYLAGSSFCLLVLDIRDGEVYIFALIATNVAFVLVAVPSLGMVPRSWSWTSARSQYRLGAYMTVIAALTGVLFGIDVIFLNHWAGKGDVGVYSVYNGFPKRLLGVLFTDGIGLVLLPALAVADKPAVMRRIARITPLVAAGTAAVAFAASTVFFFLLGGGYPYSLGLMALSSLGIGLHTVFNLYSVALSMDGVRGARLLVGCLAAGAPAALACLAACVAWWGLTGALAGFALGNAVLVAVVGTAAARAYRRTDPPRRPAAQQAETERVEAQR